MRKNDIIKLCEEYARNWKPCADKLWSETKVSPKSYENYKNK